ncbi:MAG TPA: DUF2269 family protein [Thermoleophilaceae bacterium]|jgi:uncharacterized membrane protein
MTLYEFLLTVHILAAIVWLGGSWMLLMLGLSLRGADTQRRVDFTRMTEKIPSIVFAVASIILILAGTWLVDEAGFDYSDAWVTIGYTGWFISFLFGVGFYGREGKRRERIIESEGIESPAVSASLNRVLAVAAVDSLLITLVVVDMTTKPGL